MNPETWKLIATLGGLFLTLVTGPIIWAIHAEAKLIRTELRAEMKQTTTELRAEMKESATELRAEMKESTTGLRTEMKEMETRLNGRIDTRLIHH